MGHHQVHQQGIKGIKEGEEGKESKKPSKNNRENFPQLRNNNLRIWEAQWTTSTVQWKQRSTETHHGENSGNQRQGEDAENT